MKDFHVTIMSIDPSENEEDNHQKYGLRVMATDEKDAINKGEVEFKQQHPTLPIFWVKATERVIYDPNKPIEKIYG